MNLEHIAIEEAKCHYNGKLHYRQHIERERFIKFQNSATTKHLYGYCLVEDTKCPFYTLYKNQPMCKLPDYKIK